MEEQYWQDGVHELPRPPAVPREVFGKAFRTPHAHLPGYIFAVAYQEMGPVFRMVRPGVDQVVLAGPLANQFMANHGKDYTYAREFRREQNEEFGVRQSLVSMDGEEHYQFRRLQKNGYARSALNDKYPKLIEQLQQSILAWGDDAVVSAEGILPQLIAEQLSIGVLNHPLGDQLPHILHWVRTVTIETVARIRPKSELYKPRYKKAKEVVYDLADEVIAAHRCPHHHSPDVVDDLLAAFEADEGLMTEQELRLAVLGGYIGGLDTVAYTCGFLLHSLLADPELMEAVVAEVDSAFAQGEITPNVLKQKMPMLHAAVMETLRLYPVSFAVKYTVTKPFAFAGYQIHDGEEIVCATTVPHHLDEFFPDPFKFDVTRYQAPRYEHRQQGVYAPYGIGPHICLGAGMAEVFIMLTVTTLLHTIELTLEPEDYKLQITSMPTPYPKDLQFRVSARKHPKKQKLREFALQG